MVFEVRRDDLTTEAERECVAGTGVVTDVPDDHTYLTEAPPGQIGGQLLGGGSRCRPERRAEDQVFGRVAGDG